jgi:hypothetical protein
MGRPGVSVKPLPDAVHTSWSCIEATFVDEPIVVSVKSPNGRTTVAETGGGTQARRVIWPGIHGHQPAPQSVLSVWMSLSVWASTMLYWEPSLTSATSSRCPKSWSRAYKSEETALLSPELSEVW